MPTKAKSPLGEFNLNSILVIIAGGLVTWLVNNSLNTAKDTKQAVTEIKTSLPFIAKGQDRLELDVREVKTDVKDVKATAATRKELEDRHNQLQESIKEVKEKQTNLESEIKKK